MLEDGLVVFLRLGNQVESQVINPLLLRYRRTCSHCNVKWSNRPTARGPLGALKMVFSAPNWYRGLVQGLASLVYQSSTLSFFFSEFRETVSLGRSFEFCTGNRRPMSRTAGTKSKIILRIR